MILTREYDIANQKATYSAMLVSCMHT